MNTRPDLPPYHPLTPSPHSSVLNATPNDDQHGTAVSPPDGSLTAVGQGAAVTPSRVPARLWPRLIARLVDLIVVGTPVLALTIVLFSRGGYAQGDPMIASLAVIWYALLSIIALSTLMVVYEIIGVWRWGSSIGRWMCGVMIVDLNGRKHPRFRQAALRTLTPFVLWFIAMLASTVLLPGQVPAAFMALVYVWVYVIPVLYTPLWRLDGRGAGDLVANTMTVGVTERPAVDPSGFGIVLRRVFAVTLVVISLAFIIAPQALL